MKYLERLANVAIILGVAVFIFAIVRGQIGATSSEGSQQGRPNASAKALIGKTISLPQLHYPLPHKTVLLAVSKTCHYCKDSQPFYRQLASAAQGKFDLIAVLPQSEEEAKSYLVDASVPTKQVISSNLESIGIHATPTVLLLSASGQVEEAWVGLLDAESQKSLLSRASE